MSYENTLTFYSKFKEGDKVSFEYKGKKVSGIIDSVSPDVIDSTVIPVYYLTDCDIVFPWGDSDYDSLYEKEIIES